MILGLSQVSGLNEAIYEETSRGHWKPILILHLCFCVLLLYTPPYMTEYSSWDNITIKKMGFFPLTLNLVSLQSSDKFNTFIWEPRPGTNTTQLVPGDVLVGSCSQMINCFDSREQWGLLLKVKLMKIPSLLPWVLPASN